MKRHIRVGSRDSKLAVAQTMIVLDEIKKANPELEIELITMKTTGDKILDRSLDKIGGKGLFVKELDKALLEGKIDIAIHSLKDLPMEINPDIPVVGYSKREDARDVMIVKSGCEKDFDSGIIGTSSKRREIQLKKMYPNAKFKGIRGNVQTRLNKLQTQDYSATVLAMAGLKRLGMTNCISKVFEVDEVIPAAGQGILAIQSRRDMDCSFLENVIDNNSYIMATAERAFTTTLDGGCSSPIAAYAEVQGEQLILRGLYYDEINGSYYTGIKKGNVNEARMLGEELAFELKNKN